MGFLVVFMFCGGYYWFWLYLFVWGVVDEWLYLVLGNFGVGGIGDLWNLWVWCWGVVMVIVGVFGVELLDDGIVFWW